MDRDEFAQRFGLAHRQALELARCTVTNELPSSVKFLLKPNSSHSSDPLHDDEEVFPEDTRPGQPYLGPLSEDEVVAWLWRQGKVPEWIDLAVLYEDGQHCYIGLLCCARFTGQDYLLYHQDEGYPPFHATPPRPPDGWQDLDRDGRFSLFWHAPENKSQRFRQSLAGAIREDKVSMRMMQFIKNHFRRYYQRSAWDFCWRIGVESTAVSFVVAILVGILGAPEREFPGWSMGLMFVFIVLLAPIFETLIMQALPIYIARKLHASFRAQVITGATVFALCHLAEGIAAIIAAGMVGGFYFSFAYAHWRQQSRWQAFWVTAGAHAIHNSIAFAFMLIAGI